MSLFVAVVVIACRYPRYRPRAVLERCVDWDNMRGAAVICDLQFEFEEELRCQFGHLLSVFPPPPARTTNQTDRLLTTALDLTLMYADNQPTEAQRVLLVMHVRGNRVAALCHSLSLFRRMRPWLTNYGVCCMNHALVWVVLACLPHSSTQLFAFWVRANLPVRALAYVLAERMNDLGVAIGDVLFSNPLPVAQPLGGAGGAAAAAPAIVASSGLASSGTFCVLLLLL